MILSIAYIAYKFFKKYPFAIALFVMMYSCNIYTIEKEIGEEERIETNIHLNAIDKVVINNKKPNTVFSISSQSEGEVEKYNYTTSYIKSAYHKLFILYQSISIHRTNHNNFV